MSAPLTIRRSGRSISLTALIDVVFILLMFFMLTSTFDKFGFLELQTSSSGGSGVQRTQSLVLQANGDLLNHSGTGGLALTDTELMRMFDASQPLSVLPESEANVQTMVLAVERLHRLGLANVTLGQVLPSAQDVL